MAGPTTAMTNKPGARPGLLIVTGMSGAGRSTAAKVLEDLGYAVIDNLPPALLPAAAEHHHVADGRGRVAAVVDSRGGLPTAELGAAIDELEGQGIRTMVLFLDAEDSALVRRYEENRRPHPIRGDTLPESIRDERLLLADLRDLADVVIDTTDLNVHQLRDKITDRFTESGPERSMRVSLTSFGYKHGVPRDIDLCFDVRFLPNPHWVPELRPKVGTDPEVFDYVMGNPDAAAFFQQVVDMLGFLIPKYVREGKSYLSIGVGCTGGHHRSVALAEALSSELESHGVDVVVRHRDVAR